MNQCILSPKALRDLNDISSYFAQQNIEAGERVLALFTEKCTRLIGFPNMGKSYEFLRSGIRKNSPRRLHYLLSIHRDRHYHLASSQRSEKFS